MQLDSIASTWQRMTSWETFLPVAATDLQCEGAPKKTASWETESEIIKSHSIEGKSYIGVEPAEESEFLSEYNAQGEVPRSAKQSPHKGEKI